MSNENNHIATIRHLELLAQGFLYKLADLERISTESSYSGEEVALQFKRNTAEGWATLNPVLAEGEPGYETDTGKIKIGDGVNDWYTLDYLNYSEDVVAPSVKCHLLFEETPATGTNNIYLKDETGIFDFKRVKHYLEPNTVNTSLSKKGTQSIRSEWTTWIKAPAPGTLLNINPSANYMFTISAYIQSPSPWYFWEYNGKTYSVMTSKCGISCTCSIGEEFNTVILCASDMYVARKMKQVTIYALMELERN